MMAVITAWKINNNFCRGETIMTKQLVAKPIIIESPQHFDFIKSNYNRNQQVIITCENCGSTKNISIRYAVSPYICKSCLNKKPVYDRASFLEAHSVIVIDNKNITARCKECGQQIDTTLKAFDHKCQRYGAFYCKSCIDIRLHEKRSLAQKNSNKGMRGKHYDIETLEKRNALREQSIIKKYGSLDLYKDYLSKKSKDASDSLSTEEKNSIVEKRRKTCNDKYGVDNPMKVKDLAIKMVKNTDYVKRTEKTKETIINKYGSLDYFYNEFLQPKIIESNMEHFGVPYSFQSETVKNHIKNTFLEKYGVDNFSKSIEFQGMLPFIMKSSTKKYMYDNSYFDSSWELAYYIWLKDHNVSFVYKPGFLVYTDKNNIEHKYFPDFYVEDHYVEIKGDHIFTESGELGIRGKPNDLDKFNYILNIGGEIIGSTKIRKYLKYVKEKYGRNFLKNLKIKI